ncbi:MAG: HD domain-containing protein [Gemmatimonadota bacterium]|nr:HD domain-containing protein [Gemmatimonadota bacterium]
MKLTSSRERSIRQLGRSCDFDEPHAVHVRQLSLSLFDSIGPRLGCERAGRRVLADAALLHDIGYFVSSAKHHKHSCALILRAELAGVDESEQALIANVARYHRKSEPSARHRRFAALTRTEREQVRRLSALLRVADGLDSGHSGAVGKVTVRWTGRALRICPVPRDARRAPRIEAWAAARKAGPLAKIAGLAIEIMSVDGKVLHRIVAGRRAKVA